MKSRGLVAWLWLFKKASQAKAAMKPSTWPSLAWPIWAWLTASGQALQSTKHINAQTLIHMPFHLNFHSSNFQL